MVHDSIVAINIVDLESKVLNKTLSPILYYWNGESDIVDNLRKDEQLAKQYESLFIMNPEKYSEIMLSYTYFKYDEEGNEQCDEKTVDIQDIIYLDKFNSKSVTSHYLVKQFKILYQNSFKADVTSLATNDELIIDIYKSVKNKFKSRLTKDTIINWVRSNLGETDHINPYNVNIMINNLKEILINEEV
jgi:hypothetical protein